MLVEVRAVSSVPEAPQMGIGRLSFFPLRTLVTYK